MPLTDPSIYCPLCQCDLHAAQTWHYLLEEGTEEDGSRTGQPVHRHFMEMIRLTEEERSQETTVHDYCWWIVMRIFRKVNFDQAWIDQFKSYIHLLSPFMQEAPFCDESDTLDLDVFMTFKTARRQPAVRRKRNARSTYLCPPRPFNEFIASSTEKKILSTLMTPYPLALVPNNGESSGSNTCWQMISTQEKISKLLFATCKSSQKVASQRPQIIESFGPMLRFCGPLWILCW